MRHRRIDSEQPRVSRRRTLQLLGLTAVGANAVSGTATAAKDDPEKAAEKEAKRQAKEQIIMARRKAQATKRASKETEKRAKEALKSGKRRRKDNPDYFPPEDDGDNNVGGRG